jgi:cbb3-type cytochrome oxidase maturation protein
MDSLYLLIPLSVLLVLAIGGLLVWSVMAGQFDDLDEAGRRVLRDEPESAPASAPASSDGPAQRA